MTKRPFTQVWIGGRDLTHLMTDVTGWAVGCDFEQRSLAAVQHALANGLIGYRTHYPRRSSGIEPWQAYLVTDKGLRWLEEHGGDVAAVRKQIAFYAEGERAWRAAA